MLKHLTARLENRHHSHKVRIERAIYHATMAYHDHKANANHHEAQAQQHEALARAAEKDLARLKEALAQASDTVPA